MIYKIVYTAEDGSIVRNGMKKQIMHDIYIVYYIYLNLFR